MAASPTQANSTTLTDAIGREKAAALQAWAGELLSVIRDIHGAAAEAGMAAPASAKAA